MREIRTSGSEGGAERSSVPTPYQRGVTRPLQRGETPALQAA